MHPKFRTRFKRIEAVYYRNPNCDLRFYASILPPKVFQATFAPPWPRATVEDIDEAVEAPEWVAVLSSDRPTQARNELFKTGGRTNSRGIHHPHLGTIQVEPSFPTLPEEADRRAIGALSVHFQGSEPTKIANTLGSTFGLTRQIISPGAQWRLIDNWGDVYGSLTHASTIKCRTIVTIDLPGEVAVQSLVRAAGVGGSLVEELIGPSGERLTLLHDDAGAVFGIRAMPA